MLYHLLSGRPPYTSNGESSTPREILEAVLRGDPAPLEQVAPDVTRELAAVCTKAMARDPKRRYASMAELAEDLRAFLENRVVRAHASGPLVELSKWMQRHRGVVTVLAVLLAVLVGAAVGFALLYRLADEQRTLAERRLEYLEQHPSGSRVNLAGIPTLTSFTEDFEDGALDLPLRSYDNPNAYELRDGSLSLRPGTIGIGLNDSMAVIRGDFDLAVTFRLERFSPPDRGSLWFGVAVRRARDGMLVANVRARRAGTRRGSLRWLRRQLRESR